MKQIARATIAITLLVVILALAVEILHNRRRQDQANRSMAHGFDALSRQIDAIRAPAGREGFVIQEDK